MFRQVGDQLAFFGIRSGKFLGVFLAQVDFLREDAAGAADHRTLAGAASEDRLFCFLFVLVLLLVLELWFGRQFPHQRAARHFDDEIFAGVAVHAFAHAVFAVLGDQARLVI